MKIKKEWKKDTNIIMVSVILLTIMTLSLSYSALFSVQTQSTVQEINAGNLSIVIDNSSTPIYEDLLPTLNSALPTAADSVVSGDYATLNFTNNGDINAEYVLTISRDYNALPTLSTDEDLLPFNYLNVGIFDTINNTWINFSNTDTPSYYVAVSSLTPVSGTTDAYPILNEIVNVGASKQYRVYVWLAEATPADEIGKLVYLKLDIDYTTVKAETMTSSEIAQVTE